MAETKNNVPAAGSPAVETLKSIAQKDPFLVQLQGFLSAHKTEKWCVAAIDIEHLKLYNELYGTQQGDALLSALASHLLSYAQRVGAPVSYWGNDDFLLCVADDAAQLRSIFNELQGCINTPQHEVSFNLRMGICPVAEYPDADPQALCNYAQMAVSDPSNTGIRRFTQAMLSQLKAQQQLLTELEHGLANHEFCFFLQPKCNSVTRAIVGMEALVRWNHPTRGCVSPAEFMPVLESTGLITQLDQYIWESVCETLHKWQESGSNLVPVSVNVSVADILSLDVPQIFSQLVEKYQLEPKLLTAEITESMLAENAEVVEQAIQGLHRKGFSVMMDDFGSGYSSLNMLKDTNVDAIKLDMKLIDMNEQNQNKGVQIVESVVNMAHRLNLPIIAEGVETPEQVSMLQKADCVYTQGYYFYKPMPVENAEELLAKPTNQDYWDMRRDQLRRDRRSLSVKESGDAGDSAAMQAYQIFTDSALELGLLNLVTGEYHIVKRDSSLSQAELKQEDFTECCERLVNENAIYPDDIEQFQDQTDLEILRSDLFHTQETRFLRFRQQIGNQFVWATVEFLPCRGCCAQSPWATVLMREDPQANQLSDELDFSYSHDNLTGLFNRSQYEADLRTLPYSGENTMVCTYIDVVGLHNVNDHLGHRSGDTLLCSLANAMRKFFSGSRIYRVGGDEFVVLTSAASPYDVWADCDRMRAFMREKECEISIGIQNASDLHKLTEAISLAEAAMREDKQAYYDRHGDVRQLKGLNEKLEKILVEKHDTEHFLRLIAPKYTGVYVVDLEQDILRPVIIPDFFKKTVETSGNRFSTALTAYRDIAVMPKDHDTFNAILDKDAVRQATLSGQSMECRYTRKDGVHFRVTVTPYSSSGRHINETLWVFANDESDTTPPITF